jgi:uncharacterized protein
MIHFLFSHIPILLAFVVPVSTVFDESPQIHYTHVRPSGVAGLGVYAKTFIPKGTMWYQAITDNALFISPDQYKHLELSSKNNLTEGFLHYIRTYGYCDKETLELIVALDDGRYINHSVDPNSGVPNPYDGKISVALRDIAPDEEIFENYLDYICSWDRVGMLNIFNSYFSYSSPNNFVFV